MTQALDYIHVKNSFAHKDTRVEFKPGRNYIVGNYGSGKSELLEMIGFSFFGSCALRGKASTYPKLEVELVFNHYGETFKIVRKVSDASLYLKDKETSIYAEVATSTTGVNNKIISLLGYDYTIYILSNYCQQGKLQYFSELSPAKRLQFIDKVSGIEEAKDLVDWLQSQRKTLKASLETLKFMLNKPTHSVGLDIDQDYQSELDALTFDNSCINDLNSKITALSLSGLKPLPKEIKPLRDNQKVYAEVSDAALEGFKDLFSQYTQLENELNKLETEINHLPKKPVALKSIDTTAEAIHSALKQQVLNDLDDVSLTCPSCSHVFGTEALKDLNHDLVHYSSKDLNNYLIWIDPANQEKITELNRVFKAKEKEYDLLGKIEILPKLKLDSTSYQLVLNAVTEARKSEEGYQAYIEEKEQVTLSNKTVVTEIETLKNQLQGYLEHQTNVFKRRSELTAKIVEKDLYLKQLDLYKESFEHFEKVNTEYELIVSLIKEISNIAKEIKQSTTPLINYHASSYLNMMTKGAMSSIEITDNYDLVVDGHSINLRSGAQKDLSSLAFRLSLGKSIILGMLPLFIGDEIDASSPVEVANDITSALEEMSEQGFQILLITHKDKHNLENCHIIDLG